MNYTTIELDRKDQFAVLSFNRPEKLNAISSAMGNEIREALQELKDTGAPVLIFTGKGRGFCAGVDLAEIGKRRAEDAFKRVNALLFDEIEAYSAVTIAAVNGPAYGGGLELILACDLRFAAEEAVFCLPEVKLGIVPSAGGLRRLPPLVGFSIAKEMILTARKATAREALSFGLVHHVEPLDSLLHYSIERAKEMAQLNSDALLAAKSILNAAMRSTSPETVTMESWAQALLFEKKK